jgi:hypothetical protein
MWRVSKYFANQWVVGSKRFLNWRGGPALWRSCCLQKYYFFFVRWVFLRKKSKAASGRARPRENIMKKKKSIKDPSDFEEDWSSVDFCIYTLGAKQKSAGDWCSFF